MSLDPRQSKLLRESIRYLEFSLEDLQECERNARFALLHRTFFAPGKLFLVFLGCFLLSLLFLWLGLSFSYGIYIGCFIYIGFFYNSWKNLEAGTSSSLLLADIHRSDESVMESGVIELLHWPSRHPEESLSTNASNTELRKSISLRIQSITAFLEG